MLRFENVSVNFGEKAVLSDFSFEAREGEHTCILGPSGCGKTTLWRLASGLMQPGSGRVTRFEHARAAFVFQEDRLLPWCSCFENLTAVGVPGERAVYRRRPLGGEGSDGFCHDLHVVGAAASRRKRRVAGGARAGPALSDPLAIKEAHHRRG